MEKTTTRNCPRCGKTYTEYPAISRADNTTEICPNCGVEEALIAYKLFKDENELKRRSENG